jgi:flagellar motility protein MotE (MotC chaperone)
MSNDLKEKSEAPEGDAAVKKPDSPKPAKPAAPAKPAKDKAAKKGGFPIVLVLVPIALVAALVLAFLLPPTHAMLMKSPLGPLIARLTHSSEKAGGDTAQKPVDPAAEVKRLTAAVAADKSAAAQKDAQIAQLQADKDKAAAPADAAPAPAPKPSPTSVPPDVTRAAAVWAAMDADKAAEIIKQLPDGYVEAVFGQMPADAVSDIMSELPPKVAARLTTDGAAPANGDAATPSNSNHAEAPSKTAADAPSKSAAADAKSASRRLTSPAPTR